MDGLVVTDSNIYTDIDSLACGIAYQELMRFEKVKCRAVFTGAINNSVTDKVKSWGLDFKSENNSGDNKFVLVDFSDPKKIAGFVDQDKIVEIYDHHFGYEKYWEEKLGKKAKIEYVGACATLIWQEFVKRGFVDRISVVSAKLLYTAIVSNTLNFKATVTDERDINAFNQLKLYVDLPKDWVEKYFRDQEQGLFENVEEGIRNDTKVVEFPDKAEKLVIGQVELWDSRELVENYRSQIVSVLKSFGSDFWFMTSPSISEGINYIICKNDNVKKLIKEMMNVQFDGDLGRTNKLWLRKEILREFGV